MEEKKSKKEKKGRDLCLPKTKLFVENEELIRKDKKGRVIGKFLLSDINNIEIQRKIDKYSILVLLLAAGLYYASNQYLDQRIIRSITLGLAWFLALCGIVTIRKTLLVFKVAKDSIAYEVKEDFDIAKGFMVSIKSKMNI